MLTKLQGSLSFIEPLSYYVRIRGMTAAKSAFSKLSMTARVRPCQGNIEFFTEFFPRPPAVTLERAVRKQNVVPVRLHAALVPGHAVHGEEVPRYVRGGA